MPKKGHSEVYYAFWGTGGAMDRVEATWRPQIGRCTRRGPREPRGCCRTRRGHMATPGWPVQARVVHSEERSRWAGAGQVAVPRGAGERVVRVPRVVRWLAGANHPRAWVCRWRRLVGRASLVRGAGHVAGAWSGCYCGWCLFGARRIRAPETLPRTPFVPWSFWLQISSCVEFFSFWRFFLSSPWA